jgi:hypothetical protein
MTNSICEGDGHILMLPLYQIILYAPDTRHTYQSHLNLDHRAERGSRVIGRPRKRKEIFYILHYISRTHKPVFSLLSALLAALVVLLTPSIPIRDLLLRGATAARRRGSRRAHQPCLCLLLRPGAGSPARPVIFFEQPGDLQSFIEDTLLMQ